MIRAFLSLILLAIVSAGPARAGDLSAEEQRWVKDLIEALSANSPRVRRGAEEALAKVGTDALPAIAEALPSIKGEAGRKGLKRALEGMGRAEVLAAVDRLRQGAPRATAKRYEDVAALLGATAASAAGGPTGVPLVEGRLEDASLVPVAAMRLVRERLPADFVRGAHAAREEAGALRVDTDGDGTPETVVPAGGARVVDVGRAEVGGTEGKVPLVVWARAGSWWAAPAAVLRGGSGPASVTLLDGDLDGAFDGPGDFVRAADGAFARRDETGRVLLEDGVYATKVEGEGASRRLALTREPDPAGAEDAALAGLRALDRWRRAVGLPPARLDPRKCAACTKHALYMQRNAGTPEVAGLGAHREIEGKPGYTSEGAEAAGASLLAGTGDPVAGIASLSSTMLHGAGLLGAAHGGFGIGCAGGRGGETVVWGEDPAAGEGGAPVVVPAPGQRHVAVRGRPEEPPPDAPAGWYSQPRGFPVSVLHSGLGLSKVDVRLLLDDGRTPVSGTSWNDETPLVRGYGRGQAFFMPSVPLERGRTYVAVATGQGSGGERRWAWVFSTD